MATREELEKLHQRMTQLRRNKFKAGNTRLCQTCGKDVVRPDPDPETPYIRPRFPNICEECRESFREGRRARRKAKYDAEKLERQENDPVWEDPWRVKLEEFLADKIKVSAKRCWAAVGVNFDSRTIDNNYRLSRVMKSLRWRAKKIWEGTGTVRGYVAE